MLRPISVDFCLTFDTNYRDIMLHPISVDFCLTFDDTYRDKASGNKWDGDGMSNPL